MNGGMQCEAPRAPLADANKRSGNDAMRPPFAFPPGWAEMRRLLWRDGLRRGATLRRAALRASIRIAAQRISHS